MDIENKSMPGKAGSLRWLQSEALEHAARTAVAAAVSLLTARLFGLPEAYWAAVTTLIVMQSTLGAALTVSARRLIGTALGAAIGAILATYFGSNIFVFGVGIFLLGLVCTLLGQIDRRLPTYLDRTAYRYGSIALTIVMMVMRYNSAWIVALHRFIEVSIGIVVGLLLTVLWPERQPQAGAQLVSDGK